MFLAVAAFHTTAELRTIPDEDYGKQVPFSLRGTVIAHARATNIMVADSNGCACLWADRTRPNTGDVVCVHGHTARSREGLGILCLDDFDIIGKGAIPKPTLVRPDDIANNKQEFALVRLRGFVSDATADEIDPAWSYLVIRSGTSTTYAFIPNKSPKENLDQFINAEVELTGICIPKHGGLRVFIGPHIELRDLSDITVVTYSDLARRLFGNPADIRDNARMPVLSVGNNAPQF